MTINILTGDCLEVLRTLPDESVHCCVTSPPYWRLRDYGVPGQLGLEPTPDAFVTAMVTVFREVRRVLRSDGVCFLNLGDSYANDGKWGGSTGGKHVKALHGQSIGRSKRETDLKPKDLCLIPWRVVLALQADGWWVRSIIAWAKKSPMPESCTDRPTSSWEPIFLLTKSASYFYDTEAVKEPSDNPERNAERYRYDFSGSSGADQVNDRRAVPEGKRIFDGTRNQRNVWHLGPEPFSEAHFATFPTEIPRRAILAGTSEKGCCHNCGAPWERITESTKTIGWELSCTCDAGSPIPCTVLDPFGGAGTTGLVADQLGRNAILIELNPDYVEMSRRRIKDDAGMFAKVSA
jgi:DNA modification methylase